MKKTLSVLAVLGIIAVSAQSANAAWSDSNWNPMNWFGRGCNKCEKVCQIKHCSTDRKYKERKYYAAVNKDEKSLYTHCRKDR